MRHGRTPLYAACEKGHAAVAELLLARGAEVDRANANGDTPLLARAHRLPDPAEPRAGENEPDIDGLDRRVGRGEDVGHGVGIGRARVGTSAQPRRGAKA